MSIIVLGDCHIGVRNASAIVAEYQIKFFEEVLFPFMQKNKITHILQMGDMYDTRKFSNHVIVKMWETRVFLKSQELGFTWDIILGNHDIALKNTLKVNTPELLLQDRFSNINIIKDRKMLRELQFGIWEEEKFDPKVFITPDVVTSAILSLL